MSSTTNSSELSFNSTDPLSSGDDVSTSGGVGLASASLSQGRRAMLDLVNRLHSTGVQVDIDLPQIAVVGSQSAGKSSLIESISGITLPRAAGTCTRCPTECRLSNSSAPWQCEVSLRFTTDSKGQPLGQARNEPFGGIITDKAHVEDRIRRAQRAILNPGKPVKTFLDDTHDLDFDDALSFSSNCVSLKISGADVADLSFVDLPGLIASVSSGRGHSNDIALVEGLVTSYIKRPNCIVLLTVACETDFENQGAHRLTKQYDPEGRRTIGVLTKPDRIPTGEESNWLPFIRNEKEALEHNWYCVKQPSSNDLKQNMTWSDARRREDEFFSMTAPWSELDAIYQKYLRTSNLVERLSSVLSDLISKRLPQIQEELDRSIVRVHEALNSLPPPPSANPFNEIVTMLHAFTADLRKRVVDGVPDADGLLQSIRPAQARFRKAIRETAPEFRPFEKRYAGSRSFVQPKFLDNEEELEGNDVESEVDDQEVETFATEAHTYESPASEDYPISLPYQFEDAIYVDEVLKRAHEARTRELPGHVPFVVQRAYIEEVVTQWRQPTIHLLQVVHTTLMRHMKDLVSKHFSEFGQGGLAQRVRTIVHKHLNNCFDEAQRRIEWLIELEALPFTLNNHYLSDYKDKFIAFYKTAREKEIRGQISDQIEAYNRSKLKKQSSAGEGYIGGTSRQTGYASIPIPPEPTGIEKVLRGLVEMGLQGIKADDISKMLPNDEMEPAIYIMSDVRAYFQVAYKRFADNIPLAIDHELVRGIERNMLTTLYSKLGINGPQGHRICKELAQESPQIADKRLDLEKKLERLETARAQLLNVGN